MIFQYLNLNVSTKHTHTQILVEKQKAQTNTRSIVSNCDSLLLFFFNIKFTLRIECWFLSAKKKDAKNKNARTHAHIHGEHWRINSIACIWEILIYLLRVNIKTSVFRCQFNLRVSAQYAYSCCYDKNRKLVAQKFIWF